MKYLLISIFCFTTLLSTAQEEPMLVVDDMPRFPGCELVIYDVQERQECSQKRLLQYIYGNITYPDTAILNGTEGTVVVNFVISKTGSIENANIVKDIGDGCGAAALQVINSMNGLGVKWKPGTHKGEPKNVIMNLPIKFRLDEPSDYVLMDGDTVYVNFDTPPSFMAGDSVVHEHLAKEIRYPNNWEDSCSVGVIACDILVRKNGQAILMVMNNYAGLDEAFEFEAIRLVASTTNKWHCAELKGEKVPAIYPVRITFAPSNINCQSKVENLNNSLLLGDEAATLYNNGKFAAAFLKWNEGIKMFPESVELKYWRGVAHLEQNNLAKACLDFQEVKAVLGSSGYEAILPFICSQSNN